MIFKLTQPDFLAKVSKKGKIRNRYNQAPHLTQDTNGKVTNTQLYTTNESQEVSPFPAGDHKAQTNRRTQRHNKHKNEENTKDPQRSINQERPAKHPTGGPKLGPTVQTPPPTQKQTKTHGYLARKKDPNPPSHHPQEHINEDTKRRQSKDKGPNSKQNQIPEQKKSNRQTPKLSMHHLLEHDLMLKKRNLTLNVYHVSEHSLSFILF